MCPIVPTFTCGFVRSYFALAMLRTSSLGGPVPLHTSRSRGGRLSCRSPLIWSPCPGLNRRPRPYQGRALPTELHGRNLCHRDQHPARKTARRLARLWSGKRDSNPRPPAWKAGALPLSYSRPSTSAAVLGARARRAQSTWWGGEDLNPRRRTPADLQSAPFGHLGTSPNLPACDGILDHS